MSRIDAIDISNVEFSSTVFPTDEDMKLWESLSPAEQRAAIMRDVKQGLEGPPASKASKAEIMGEVLDELKHGI